MMLLKCTRFLYLQLNFTLSVDTNSTKLSVEASSKEKVEAEEEQKQEEEEKPAAEDLVVFEDIDRHKTCVSATSHVKGFVQVLFCF